MHAEVWRVSMALSLPLLLSGSQSFIVCVAQHIQ